MQNDQIIDNTKAILNEKGKEKRKYAPRPTSRANVAKARDVRMSALKKAKDEYELKRLMELQEAKLNEIKKGMGLAEPKTPTVPMQQNEQTQPIPIPQHHQQQKRSKTVVVAAESDSDSESSDEDEIIYVPTKKTRTHKVKKIDATEDIKRELEELKKRVNEPKVEPPKIEQPQVKSPEPQVSAYDHLQRSQLDFLKNTIMKF